jgi:glutamate racemase
VIARVIGRHVRIVDSASSVADEVHDILMSFGALSCLSGRPEHRFFATDAVEHFIRVGEKFLGTRIQRAERAIYV